MQQSVKAHAVKVFCPFYKGDTDRNIVCEGIETDIDTQNFATSAAKMQFMRRVCQTHGYNDTCQLAWALEEKHNAYSRKGGGKEIAKCMR